MAKTSIISYSPMIRRESLTIKTIRAVIYARVSSKEQADKKFSIPEIQVPQCKDLVKGSSWRFVKCYLDEGYDGNAFQNRPDLQKMLIEDIDTYDVIIVWSFDRLVRDDPYTEANIYKILDRHKKQVTSVLQRVEILDQDEYDPKSLNVATHRRFRSMQVAYDSLTRRERFMASKEATVMKGKHISEPPYGYKMIRKIDPKNQRRTIGYRAPNEEESSILKRIFRERVLEGKSYRQIAFGLNQDEIKTRRGEWWSGSRISQVLRNPFPCGYISWHKTEDRKYGDERMKKVIPEEDWKLIPVDKKLEKYYKLIISEDLYRKAREIRKRNRQIKGRGASSINNILSGLIRCPRCGAPMVETGIYKIKKPPYKKGFYQCHRWSNKRLCSPVRYPSWSVKKKVLEKVKAFLNDPLAFEEYLKEKNTVEIKEKEREFKSCEQKLKKAQKKIESLNLKYLDGKIKDEYYSDLLPKLERGVKKWKEDFLALQEEMQSFYQEKKEKKSLKALSEEIKDRFENLEPQQMKLILNILIKGVVPSKEMKGRGVKGDPRENNPTITWKNPAIMEQECACQKQQ